ncbi:MAG: hypothetical protein KGK05_06150, partial [Xanthomonadaceae bacterium]|nr:hypothetical protein [Xanthomonadaceae bacterium]
MFEKTISLFDAYCQNLHNRGVAYNGDAAAEVRERLQQLTYLVTRVRALEQEVGKLMSRGTEELAKHFENLKATGAEYKAEEIPAVAKRTAEEMMFMSHAAFEAQLMTETFYYIAGRVRTVLRNKTHPIPGLNSFECVGI